MKRRELLTGIAGAAGGLLTLHFTLACSDAPARGGRESTGEDSQRDTLLDGSADGDAHASDAGDASDAHHPTVRLYDTNAVALYFDGSNGPYTGVIEVAYILANVELTLDFWHGHDGVLHRFTLTPAHFADVKKLKKVTIETTVVEDHTHLLFIDPVSTTYRVPHAVGVDVPI